MNWFCLYSVDIIWLKGRRGAEIEILEKFIKGKISEQTCEDAFFVSDDFVAVIDGVTSKSDFMYNGKTTGKITAEIIYEIFKTIKRETKLQEIIQLINQKIREFYQAVEFPYSKKEKGLQAACIIYSDYYREIWMIGDCQAYVDGKVYFNQKKSDVVLSDMRSLILHILKAENADWEYAQEEGRRQIEPWILKANVFANKPESQYGYAVLNGEEIPEILIKKIKLDKHQHKVIFTSDGYPDIKENLKLTEEYLKTILEMDAACCEMYLSTKGIKGGQKSFDDRTYIKFLV